jgi:RNA polymerase sigma-70 factor (ECF subfamily)
MDENRALIERILAGNAGAFEEFIARFQRLVSHIVFRMIDNRADREDICQDVFIGIYRGLPDFRFESKVSTWVGRVAYYRCLNHLEKMKTSLFEDISGENQTVDDVAGRSLRPDDYAETQDISARVRAEIAKLPVRFRAILTLYHLDQMSYNEIAEIMKMPEGTVKSYLFRARKLLKKRLEAKYRPEELWR